MLTRDSFVLIIGVLMGLVLFLAGTKPIAEWGYFDWLAAAGYLLSVASAQLGTSPLKGAPPEDRIKPRLGLVVLLLILPLAAPSCAPVPKPLSPEATLAFQAVRVVKVLDVVRDAAIAANELPTPLISTDSTRVVVLWHKTAVQVIMAVPGGWKPTVKEGIYRLTCDPRAGTGPCTSPLAPAEVQRLTPYVGLALVVIAEVM